MANPATLDDVESRWRSLTAAETTIVLTRLDDAWGHLLARRPTLEADITAGTVTEANVIRIVADMVIRLMKNPDGYRSVSIDDFSFTRDDLVSAGVLYVTDSELADLTPSGHRRSRSVRLVAHGEH